MPIDGVSPLLRRYCKLQCSQYARRCLVQVLLDSGRLTSADFISKFLDQIEGHDTAARVLISVAPPMAAVLIRTCGPS